jgi:hypothetical protein
VSVIINDVKGMMGYGNYYGYASYGYTRYGYGYQSNMSNYFDIGEKKRSLWKKIRKVVGV